MHPPRPHMPDKAAIEAMPLFERLGLDRVHRVQDALQAEAAALALQAHAVWGFDTESKPTFVKDQVSDGPHVLQLATPNGAWVFQLQEPGCRAVAARLLAWDGAAKVGFGLGDDQKRIRAKLGVEATRVLDLNSVFRRMGHRHDMGVKGAVALVFQRCFQKSKKAATSNWAQAVLTDHQVLYAANDAWGALRVYQGLGLGGAAG